MRLRVQALARVAAQLRAADRAGSLAAGAPNWARALQGLSDAAAEQAGMAAHVQQLSAAAPAAASPGQPAEPEDFGSALEAAVTSVLLWAQAAATQEAPEQAQPGEGARPAW
jgi:hypothetical protein